MKFRIDVTAGEPYNLPGGNMFKLRSTVYPVDVIFMGPDGQELTADGAEDAEAGFEIRPERSMILDRYGNRPRAFMSCQVLSAEDQTIELYIADGEVGDDRTTGVVQVTDGAKARVDAKKSFGGRDFLGASPANYAHFQLWNPSSNTKSVYVKSIYVHAATAATTFVIYPSSSALTTLSPYSIKSADQSAPNDTLREIRNDALGSLPSSADNYLYVPVIAADVGKLLSHTFEDPRKIPPGSGMLVANNTVNQSCGAIFEFYEE